MLQLTAATSPGRNPNPVSVKVFASADSTRVPPVRAPLYLDWNINLFPSDLRETSYRPGLSPCITQKTFPASPIAKIAGVRMGA